MYSFSDHAKALLGTYYMKDEDGSTEEAFHRAAYAYASTPELAQRIYEYACKGWFMFSSPILSNANGNGMPISCFLTYVEDTVEGLIEHTEELRWMSVMGGGVGGHWDHVRSVSKKSPGPIPFLKTVDSDMVAYRQGQTRKGSYAAYLDVSHPDLIEFLNVRMPTGGDPARKCFNINNAVNLTDEFMTAVMSGSKWDLVDPADKTVRDTVDARELWQRILEVRFRTGEPYLNFIDEANRHLPQPLKDKGLKIHGSNLCNEIHLPTGVGRSAVCCLSSLNVEMFDEWKDTSIVEDLIEFLDDVLQFFIENAPAQLGKAVRSAQSERSLGLGTMGFHAYLQKKGLPFESVFAVSANRKIYSTIKERAVASSRRLAELKGEYLDGVGSGMRNSHLLAIAPNANSAIILDTSPSIEPWKSNAFTHRTRAGSFLQFNKYLRAVLESHQERLPEEDREEWIDDQVQSIILAQGSVQHLDYLTVSERDTFKTAFELDQMWVVEHAGVRQEWICQGQSVNLFFPAGSDKNYVNAVHLSAWKKQLKGLYYLRTSAGVVADKVSEKIERKALKDYDIDECISCQG
jgi:ribonucleoside-diphosphate reductase alpha chain